MAKPVTMANLEAAVRWQSDNERELLRHTSESVRAEINRSIQRYREKVSQSGDPYYLTSHSDSIQGGETESPTDSTVRYPWSTFDTKPLDPPVARIYSLETDIGGVRAELMHVGFNQRNEFQQDDDYAWNGNPIAFFVYDETKIGFLPAAAGEMKFTIWYLPVLPDLVGDADEFNPGIVGGEQWIVWDVMHKLYMRDNYTPLIAPTMAQRDMVWDDIRQHLNNHTRSAMHRLDTVRMKRRNMGRTRGFYR